MVITENLSQRLSMAEACRKAKQWQEAIDHYLYADDCLPGQASIKHNLAVCHLGVGDAHQSLHYCNAALHLNETLWQSKVIKAKALKKIGEYGEAITILLSLLEHYPNNAEAKIELAAMSFHEIGDAVLARRLAQEFINDPVHGADASLMTIMSQLYDRDVSAEELTQELCAFADKHFVLQGSVARDSIRMNSSRMRIGMISPLFSCSPVYFFCIGALKLLSASADLIIFSRRTCHDWATQEFQAIAYEWFDVSGMNSEALASFLHKQNLDVLLDMGGWMDPIALRALSSKPAKRMYKWVGGQSATTGIRAFDGILSDEYQTPHSLQHLYVEPLILLEGGYVSYTEPPYMPQPLTPHEKEIRLGVISNPAKISRDFLRYLEDQLKAMKNEFLAPINLCFIDRRYRYPQLMNRINSALHGITKDGAITIEFIVPKDHRSYLHEVARLTAVIDTFPYSGGVTSIEALALGVPCFTRPGLLFSERHTYSHCKYAGMDLEQIELNGLLRDGVLNTIARKRGDVQRHSLLRACSGRIDHSALASALWRQFNHSL